MLNISDAPPVWQVVILWRERCSIITMTGYGFFRALRSALLPLVFALIGLVFLGGYIYRELALELSFRSRIGVNWQSEYEGANGSLARAHAKIVISALGMLAICALVMWLARLVRGNHRPHHRAHRHWERPGSRLERTVRFRRNAVIGVFFGVLGILASVLLVVFRWGIFAHHADEVAAGMFVFLGGYLAAVWGCANWLRAKGQTEGIVVIAFLPLGILLIPFVRLIFLASPSLLPVMMVMMPMILMVIVAVLSDKSGNPKRHGWGAEGWRRLGKGSDGEHQEAGKPRAGRGETPRSAN
jgi:hypothetical protein